MENTNINSKLVTEKTFFRKSFLIAGIGFVAICLIGLIVNFIIDSSGVLKEELNSTSRLQLDMYKNVRLSNAISRLARFSLFGMGIIFASAILNLVWAFRVLKASKRFIYFTFSFYILGQGIGFGILFVTWKAIDLIAIFGIAGGMFLLMAIIGYTSKNLLPLGRWLMIGSLFAMVLMVINMILFLAGVYNDTLSVILYSILGFLVLGWIAYDVWSIKKTSQYASSVGGFDEMTNFRLVMWSGFRLLSNLIALIWIVARFYGRSS